MGGAAAARRSPLCDRRGVFPHMPLKRWCIKRSRPADEAVLCNLLCKFCTRIFVGRGFRGIGDLESKFVQGLKLLIDLFLRKTSSSWRHRDAWLQIGRAH